MGGVAKKKQKTKFGCKKYFSKFTLSTSGDVLGVTMYKTFKCDEEQVPHYNVQASKSENFKNYGSLIKHGPHWIIFIILTFISENNIYFKHMYKISREFILFDIKKGKSKTSLSFVKKNVCLKVLGVLPCVY